MNSAKTIGQQIDEWFSINEPEYETLYFYYDKNADSHIIVTKGYQYHDWQEIITNDINLTQIVEAKKKEIKSLQGKINTLQREKKTVENAIRKLTKPFSATQSKGDKNV